MNRNEQNDIALSISKRNSSLDSTSQSLKSKKVMFRKENSSSKKINILSTNKNSNNTAFKRNINNININKSRNLPENLPICISQLTNIKNFNELPTKIKQKKNKYSSTNNLSIKELFFDNEIFYKDNIYKDINNNYNNFHQPKTNSSFKKYISRNSKCLVINDLLNSANINLNKIYSNVTSPRSPKSPKSMFIPEKDNSSFLSPLRLKSNLKIPNFPKSPIGDIKYRIKDIKKKTFLNRSPINNNSSILDNNLSDINIIINKANNKSEKDVSSFDLYGNNINNINSIYNNNNSINNIIDSKINNSINNYPNLKFSFNKLNKLNKSINSKINNNQNRNILKPINKLIINNININKNRFLNLIEKNSKKSKLSKLIINLRDDNNNMEEKKISEIKKKIIQKDKENKSENIIEVEKSFLSNKKNIEIDISRSDNDTIIKEKILSNNKDKNSEINENKTETNENNENTVIKDEKINKPENNNLDMIEKIVKIENNLKNKDNKLYEDCNLDKKEKELEKKNNIDNKQIKLDDKDNKENNEIKSIEKDNLQNNNMNLNKVDIKDNNDDIKLNDKNNIENNESKLNEKDRQDNNEIKLEEKENEENNKKVEFKNNTIENTIVKSLSISNKKNILKIKNKKKFRITDYFNKNKNHYSYMIIKPKKLLLKKEKFINKLNREIENIKIKKNLLFSKATVLLLNAKKKDLYFSKKYKKFKNKDSIKNIIQFDACKSFNIKLLNIYNNEIKNDLNNEENNIIEYKNKNNKLRNYCCTENYIFKFINKKYEFEGVETLKTKRDIKNRRKSLTLTPEKLNQILSFKNRIKQENFPLLKTKPLYFNNEIKWKNTNTNFMFIHKFILREHLLELNMDIPQYYKMKPDEDDKMISFINLSSNKSVSSSGKNKGVASLLRNSGIIRFSKKPKNSFKRSASFIDLASFQRKNTLDMEKKPVNMNNFSILSKKIFYDNGKKKSSKYLKKSYLLNINEVDDEIKDEEDDDEVKETPFILQLNEDDCNVKRKGEFLLQNYKTIEDIYIGLSFLIIEGKERLFLNKLNELKDLIDINCQILDGNTFLIIATREGNKNIIKTLCEKNCEINIQNDKGNTALHYAIGNLSFNIVDLLISYGAKEDIQNNDGLRPWDCIGHYLE